MQDTGEDYLVLEFDNSLLIDLSLRNTERLVSGRRSPVRLAGGQLVVQ